MKRIITPLIFLILVGCGEKINQEKVSYENEMILVGKADWNGLTRSPYDSWFTPNYYNYAVDSSTLQGISGLLDDVEIILFLGTWCSDSQVQVPQFFKILDHLGYPLGKMEVISLEKLEDGKLVSPGGIEDQYGIGYVPTYIFLRDDMEIGRITEYPVTSLERDMSEIIISGSK